ncbi:MAG TPA: putative Na+/H+ antiporter [Ideonella sp.]|uniref:putative Na+/H+ antiporter n=1 Tax=Ideonella sp. TaxID=1929293 RepID=UPI002CF65E9E|nr:putative Na+/H+ antiporter [Ideonella sp.]HSI47591.1 putative Na+/H+ antiporter [Ideonella sp.]
MNAAVVMQWVAAAVFALALLHTFSTKFFERLAQRSPRHAGIWHLLAEVEVVFGFWAMLLMLAMFALQGSEQATAYIDGRNFGEPMFVFAIMVMAGTRPVLQACAALVRLLAALLPLPRALAGFFVTLSVVPLLGSFITEPAAMTLAALLLRDGSCNAAASTRLKYAALGVLFVNVSIGGTLTSFAAPPVLMVAEVWHWDSLYMLSHLGWRAALAVLFNAALLAWCFRRELVAMAKPVSGPVTADAPVPLAMMAAHGLFLLGVVVFSHHPAVFMALFLFFLGFTHAYERHQSPLILREALLVAFFLAGLVVLGGLQQWWLQPLLLRMDDTAIYFGATALTAVTDNAALTYLGSLVPGLSESFKLALVAGAVTGGGLTLIANAPNPAGGAILRDSFEGGVINPLGLLLAAVPPTLVAMLAFRCL